MKSFSAVAALAFLLALSVAPIASAQVTLPTIPVNGTYNPCYYGVSCVYGRGMKAFLVPMPSPMPPIVASIGMDEGLLVATCQSLKDSARQIGCNVDNPPPAPGFPSPTQGQWASNGCGDGSWKTAAMEVVIKLGVGVGRPLNSPLPGVSFVPACGGHDSCYHIASKALCDNMFKFSLSQICDSAFLSSACNLVANGYYAAVRDHGQGAFDIDQRIQECAKISNDLKHGNCVS